jgi:hypothetical protein
MWTAHGDPTPEAAIDFVIDGLDEILLGARWRSPRCWGVIALNYRLSTATSPLDETIQSLWISEHKTQDTGFTWESSS